MKRIFVATAASLLLAAIPSAWADVVDDCAQREKDALKVSACTQLISGGNGDAKVRAALFFERGLGHVGMNNLDLGMADYNQAISLDPDQLEALYNRGILNDYRAKHPAAKSDFERTLALVQKMRATNSAKELTDFASELEGRIAKATAEVDLENHWVKYLAGIQAAKTYPNWSGPPSDLYKQNHQ
jgi:tetratricopeptide (TPR) repeat protein